MIRNDAYKSKMHPPLQNPGKNADQDGKYKSEVPCSGKSLREPIIVAFTNDHLVSTKINS